MLIFGFLALIKIQSNIRIFDEKLPLILDLYEKNNYCFDKEYQIDIDLTKTI